MKINERSLVSLASDSTSSDKAGFLMKKGEVNKANQRRYFVLRGNMLFYFERQQDKDPVGVIILENCHVELAATEESMFAFQIVFEGSGTRRYVLAADDNDTMESWMKSITHAGYCYMKAMVEDLEKRLETLKKVESETLNAPLLVPENVQGSGNVPTSSVERSNETSEPAANSNAISKSRTLPLKRYGKKSTHLDNDAAYNRWSLASSLPHQTADCLIKLNPSTEFQDLIDFSERTDFLHNDSLHSNRHFSINDFTPPSFSELKLHEEMEDRTLFDVGAPLDEDKKTEKPIFANSLTNKLKGNRFGRAKSERRHKFGMISTPKNGMGGSFHQQSKTSRDDSNIRDESTSSQFQHLHKLWGAAIWVKVMEYELELGKDMDSKL